MRLPVDDEIYNVDAVWLGPPGKTLPFRARYVAYAIAALIFFLLQVLERRLGIGMGFFPLAYSLLVTAGLTRLVLAFVDHDRPVITVAQAFINELTAPRFTTASTTTTLRPSRVAAVPLRLPRHGRRGEES
ncbi:hypothetical protein [Janibacter melonis]|uniref:hypothetical protein n=1 Tax=Janibacter melonis TaxID=262209 RepID=UPI00174D5EFA|nr:hypothetical protein [Janibacter melonis]